MEAITCRPLLLAEVGKAVSHANQTTLALTPLHGKAGALRSLIANVGAALRHVRQAEEQLDHPERRALLVRYVSDKNAPILRPFQPPDNLRASG